MDLETLRKKLRDGTAAKVFIRPNNTPAAVVRAMEALVSGDEDEFDETILDTTTLKKATNVYVVQVIRIDVDGLAFHIVQGRNGRFGERFQGTHVIEKGLTLDKANALAAKVVAEKVEKGYNQVPNDGRDC